MIYAALFFLAFWGGFSIRRGSICLVRATLEVIERKPPKTLLFVIEALAVALSITIPAIIFFSDTISVTSTYDVSAYLILGAILFGVGAAMNGGCTLGTLNQLMNGRIHFVATIFGLAFGFFAFLNFDLIETINGLKHSGEKEINLFLMIPILLLVWSFVLFQIIRFVKKDSDVKLMKLRQYLTSPIARDFIGVLIFGFCSGMIYLLLGHSWTYTGLINEIEKCFYLGLEMNNNIINIFITTVALLCGMGIATILSNSFHYEPAPLGAYLNNFIAGSLMGIGAGLIPGGNDTLILNGLPGLALHAPIALMLMMMSIAVVFIIQKKIMTIKHPHD